MGGKGVPHVGLEVLVVVLCSSTKWPDAHFFIALFLIFKGVPRFKMEVSKSLIALPSV